MPPPKARLHSKTGKLKTINKTYASSSPVSQANGNSSGSGLASGASSSRRNNRAAENTVTQSTPRVNTNATTVSPTPSPTASSSDTAQQFEIELCWCIQTMEKSLESGNISAKQAQDMEKTIRLLKSSNQPVIKKRQIMHTAFGDYRAKMQEEEKRLNLGTHSIQFIDSSNANDANKKSAASTATASTASKSYFVKKSLTSTLGEKTFQFDFPVSEIEKLKIEPAQPSSETEMVATDSGAVNGPIVPSKIVASDNSFKFNFSIN